MAVRAPFTGELIATLPAGAPEDMTYAFNRARRAQRAWAALPFASRARVFKRYHDLILERQEEALDLIQLEGGKARYNAFEEVGDVAGVCRFYAYHGEAALARSAAPGLVPLLTQVE
ncbi:MAG: aldehyde dehydrogenase family protein, partial [Rhodothermaceae bacterium]|nr:aldehyde dehydrogenase family protein [Rhodothermaceae bacterium]